MLAAIPVAEFMDPPKGSRPWKALDRALTLKPDVQLVRSNLRSHGVTKETSEYEITERKGFKWHDWHY